MLKLISIVLLSATYLLGCGNFGNESQKDIGFADIESKFSIGNIKMVDIVHLNKDELLSKLGDEYEIIAGVGAESAMDGYYYSKYDIVVIFDHYDEFYCIECGDEFNLNGVRLGMTIHEIQGILGEGEILNYKGHAYFEYALVYRYKEFSLWFDLLEDNERTQSFIISPILT